VLVTAVLQRVHPGCELALRHLITGGVSKLW
jgi:hypothetical protein